jgi:hypothetical protein
LDTAIIEEQPAFQKVRYLLALTDNTELNELLCHRWGEVLGRDKVFRWSALKGDRPESDVTHGTVVFPDLPRPSIASNELRSGIARLEAVAVEGTEEAVKGQILFVLRGVDALPITAGTAEKFKPSDRVLLLSRRTGYLAACFDSGDVMDFVTTDLEELFAQMKRSLHKRFEALNGEELWDLSAGTQQHLLRLPGRGVALAHAHSRQLKQRICILARLSETVPVVGEARHLRLIFFLIGPELDAEGHSATLAEFEQFCSQSANLEALHRFGKASEALSFLRQYRGVIA